MELARTSHTTYRIAYHFCWIPKYRKMVLKPDIAEALESLHERIALHYDLKILAQEVMADHVHLLVSAPPRLSPARIVQILKSVSARELLKRFPQLREQYWGGRLWTESYFVETVGSKRLDAVKQYIQTQKQETIDL